MAKYYSIITFGTSCYTSYGIVSLLYSQISELMYFWDCPICSLVLSWVCTFEKTSWRLSHIIGSRCAS